MTRFRVHAVLAAFVTVSVLAMSAGSASAAFPPRFFPFSPSWTHALPSGELPLDPGNSIMKSSWALQSHDGSFSQGYGPNIYEVTNADQAVPVTCAKYCTNVPTSFRVPPSGVSGGGGSDGWIAIVNTETHVELDLWQGSQDAAGLHGNGGSQFNTTWGTGWACRNTPTNPLTCYSATASGSALTAGTIMPSDIAAGVIRHAVAFVPRIVRANFTACPATHHDGIGKNAAPEGATFFLDRSFVIPAQWAPISKMVAKALQDYGGIVVDQGSWTFRFQANGVYTGAWDGAPVHYPQGYADWQGKTAFPWNQLNFLPITQC